MVVGGIVGYDAAGGSKKWFAAAFGVVAGMVVFFILTWVVLIFVGTKRDRRTDR